MVEWGRYYIYHPPSLAKALESSEVTVLGVRLSGGRTANYQLNCTRNDSGGTKKTTKAVPSSRRVPNTLKGSGVCIQVFGLLLPA